MTSQFVPGNNLATSRIGVGIQVCNGPIVTGNTQEYLETLFVLLVICRSPGQCPLVLINAAVWDLSLRHWCVSPHTSYVLMC